MTALPALERSVSLATRLVTVAARTGDLLKVYTLTNSAGVLERCAIGTQERCFSPS